MLGWEFPPIMAGGLGTACYGLCNALKEYADVTLILPKTDHSVKLDGVNILGMNFYNLNPETSVEPPKPYIEIVEEIEYVEAGDLSPYPMGFQYAKAIENIVFPTEDAAAIRALYSTDEPYGPNIMEKVAVYAEVAAKVALTKEFDVIHAHDWITYPAAIKIKEATGKPLVLHIHSLETDRIGTHAKNMINAVYDIERHGMLAADLLIPVSTYTQKCAEEHYGIDSNKFRPVYNAIDPEDSVRIERGSDEKIVLFLGRITYQKGPEFMAETAFKVLQKYPKALFFVAGVGDMLAQLKERVEYYGIRERFIFAGFLNKKMVKQVLAQADVYFMPSVSEPFGLSALEAAQYMIPCVLSRQSGVAEVLDHALKADFWDTDKFANYIYGLLSYEGIRKEMIENTLEDLEELTWDDSARDVISVYQEALQAK